MMVFRAAEHWCLSSVRFAGWSANSTKAAAYIKEFTPQPYLQLASIVRQAGYDRAADQVLLRLERNRTRWSDQGAWAQIGGWLYDVAIKRGFAAFRPLWLLFCLWLFSAVAFRAAYDARDFLPAKDNLVTEERLKSGDPGTTSKSPNNEQILVAFDPGKTGKGPYNEQVLVAFKPWTYAFEVVVPLIAIDGKQDWFFRDPSDTAAHSTLTLTQRVLDWFAHRLVVFGPILGWIMTSFLVTGIAGLIRSPRG